MSLPDYAVLTATCFDEAEAALRGHGEHVALVCVDHQLSGRTGLEFIQLLRDRHPHVPSLLFTGQASPQVADRALALGARVLWKPIRLAVWLAEVQALLRQGVPAGAV